MKKTILVACISMAAVISIAGPSPKPVQSLGFEEVKEACLNPARFQNQTAPTNIQISCRDVQLKWIATPDGQYKLPTSHVVTTSLKSDKYAFNSVVEKLDSSMQVVACLQYEQVSEQVDMVKSASCDELIGFVGTGTDYCAAAVVALRASNSAAVETTATGVKMSFCPIREN